MPSNHTTVGAWVNSKLSGRNPPLYCTFQIDHHAGAPKHDSHKRNYKLGYISICYIGFRIGWVSKEGSLQVIAIDRADNGKLPNIITILLLYGTYFPVALVVLVIHTISYICDSMRKR